MHGSLGPPFITQGVTTETAVHASGDATHAGHAPPTLFRASAAPNCRAELSVDEAASELVCTGCRYAYPVRDNIPVLLVDEARKPDGAH